MKQMRRVTAAAFESRIPIFGLGRKTTSKIVVESRWGRATITGRLTQAHRSILDVLFTHYEPKRASGMIAYLVTQYGMLARLGKQNDGRNRKWLLERLRELTVTGLEVERKGEVSYSQILSRVKATTIPSRSGEHFLGIVINPDYLQLVESDVGIRYTPDELATILELPPAAQAVARFMLSHSRASAKFEANFPLKNVIEYIGLAPGSRAAYRAQDAVRASAETFQRLGVRVTGERGSESLTLERRGARGLAGPAEAGEVEDALAVI